MEQYLIRGGHPLRGEVEISGSKNSSLGILAAAIMCDETVTVRNLPDVNDINVFLHAIQEIGATVNYPDLTDRHVVEISGGTIHTHLVDNEYIRKIRASYYLVGAMLGKYSEASVAMPGGCEIGKRPIDQHRKGFEAMGAVMEDDTVNNIINVHAEHLHGETIYLDMPSVGATINIMLAAALAPGKTMIYNAAREPHIVDVARFLNRMGADIRGAGTDTIKIKGVEKLHSADHEIIPDQIEAGTFMCAAVATGGDVTLTHVVPEHLNSISQKLKEMGTTIIDCGWALRVIAPTDKRLKPTNIHTQPHPGFPTDMQPQIAVCLALADGKSTIKETIFESRFKYIHELNKMGANITVETEKGDIDENGNEGPARQTKAHVYGVEQLHGAVVTSPDLRAGAALVIAGLSADGQTRVQDIRYIHRGYEEFEEKIRRLGGMIERIDI